ncbi:smoothelin-like protein 1, partial [Heptranchias perlo]|uniref:smoothelin-like protein 1 n=1 Tax=Heptranchias perlo TaxID=212740 RepID=UPI00355ABDA7
MEFSSQDPHLVGEYSGMEADTPCSGRPGDAKQGEGTMETVFANELRGEEESPDHEVGASPLEKDKEMDEGKVEEQTVGGGPGENVHTSVKEGVETSVDTSPTNAATIPLDTPGPARGTPTVESGIGDTESLSMTSLSRSLTKEDIISLSGPAVHAAKEAEIRWELGRSQTIPRSYGAQSRRSLAEKFEKQSVGTKACKDAKGRAHRSTSLGVSGGSSVKQMLLDWCRTNTRNYKYVDIHNFSSSWSDGMAFCALVHKFFPDSFDYSTLSPKNRKANFELAFNTAEMSADCTQLLEVGDLLHAGSPDWKCIYTYVQEFYRCLVQKGLVKTSRPSHPK